MNKIRRFILKSKLARKIRELFSELKYKFLHTFRIYVKKEDLLNFWKNPTEDNQPDQYLQGGQKSIFLVKFINKNCSKKSKILEIGCNVGRNLNFLYRKGFRNLSAIEPNKKAVRLLKSKYPQMAKSVKIFEFPAENIIKKFIDSAFDVVFTMAVLEHIHPDSEWIFSEMSRISGKYVITIENEKHHFWRSFVRNYRRIFETLGMKQIEEINCKDVEGLGDTYIARVFKK